MIAGPGQGVRRTGTWKDSRGKVHPIINGRRCVTGSIADIGKATFVEDLDRQLREAGGQGLISRLADRLVVVEEEDEA